MTQPPVPSPYRRPRRSVWSSHLDCPPAKPCSHCGRCPVCGKGYLSLPFPEDSKVWFDGEDTWL